jgi:hypothetical protein
MEAENPLAVLQEKILTWTIKEITPFGIKHEFNTEGQDSWRTIFGPTH